MKKRTCVTSLMYLEKDNQYLMLWRNKKEKDYNKGKWIGVGGKKEENETIDECVKREVLEETGLMVNSFHFYGIIRFRADVDEDMYLYSSSDFSGELLKTCDEGELHWVEKDQILSLNLWEGDRVFLKEMLEGKSSINMTLIYQKDRLVEVLRDNPTEIQIIEKNPDGRDLISLKNRNIEVVVSSFGCTIQKMLVKDKTGRMKDVVLGYDHMEDYDRKYDGYLGAVVGRVANRIRNGQFKLNGITYQLAVNNGPNCLHGGNIGFSYRIFHYAIEEDRVIFDYISPDMEENFPGNLHLYVTYLLCDCGLKISYYATCDKDTILNITNHSYFNLSGECCRIDDHYLQIKADAFGCIDENTLFNREIRKVDNTPFDFREEKRIGDGLQMEDEQLKLGNGYDHSFIFSDKKDQIRLYCPQSGIEMKISTTCPQVQLYSGNYLRNQTGKDGLPLIPNGGICLETQYQPDAINLENDTSTILRKGEEYREDSIYQFFTR